RRGGARTPRAARAARGGRRGPRGPPGRLQETEAEARVIRPEEAARPFTVTELALEVKRALRPLSSVLVKGEVSGMKVSAKGHYSFAVRGAGAVIQAFLFAGDARRLGLVPEDGQEFIFRG